MKNKPVIVALDDPEYVLSLAQKLSPQLCRIKIGNIVFTRKGTALIEKLQSLGYEIFLDLKFHDIPNTVAGAVRSAADLGVWMVNVHAAGGIAMMEAAADALANCQNPPLLIAVTVLTSMDSHALSATGVYSPVEEQVMRLTKLAAEAGLNGVVCSAHEAGAVKQNFGEHFLTVTPGIRPVSSSQNDQIRTMTPEKAIRCGSDFLVIGRPITCSVTPDKVLASVISSLTRRNDI